jgi:hypothetical protein
MEYYTARYAAANPEEMSTRSGVRFENGSFYITILGQPLYAGWPTFTLKAESESCPGVLLDTYTRILVIRYLLEGVSAPSSGKFLTYRELPWGEVYNENFEGRCIRRLAFMFGNRLEGFNTAVEKLGGRALSLGDASAELQFLGDVRVRLILHEGDDEFPPSSQFLFSDNAQLAFTAEDLAAVGDIIISALKSYI